MLELLDLRDSDRFLNGSQYSFNSLRPSHAYLGNLTIIVSDNGLSSGRRQAIIWTNVIGP